MHIVARAVVSGGLMLSASLAWAADGASANLGITNDFIWRGVSQTDNRFAVQGGADYNDKTGLYIGAWGSNVDIKNANVRVDLYGGYRFKTDSGLMGDVGAITYRFDGGGLSFSELYGSLTFANYTAKLSHDWRNDRTYVEAGALYDLGSKVNFGVHAGHYTGGNINNPSGYNDYSVGLGTTVSDFDITLTVSDTDIRPATDRSNANVALLVKKTFRE